MGAPKKTVSGQAKRAAFVREYLVDKNATQAALRAGYSKKSAHMAGYELLKDPEVYSAIRKGLQKQADDAERRAAERGFTLDKWRRELERIAGVDVDDFISYDGFMGRPRVKNTLERLPGSGRAVKKVASTKMGESVELHDKMKALQLLGEHYGWISKKVELTGDEDKPVVVVTLPANTREAPSNGEPTGELQQDTAQPDSAPENPSPPSASPENSDRPPTGSAV